MKQDQILDFTKKATEKPLEYTHSVIEKSKKLRTPSHKVDSIGTTIGECIGGGFLFAGTVQIVMGRPLWALGSVAVGMATILSNHYHKKKVNM